MQAPVRRLHAFIKRQDGRKDADVEAMTAADARRRRSRLSRYRSAEAATGFACRAFIIMSIRSGRSAEITPPSIHHCQTFHASALPLDGFQRSDTAGR